MDGGKKEIFLLFTRSFNLYLAEFWRKPLLIPNVKKFLGYGLSDQICFSDGRTQYYYRVAGDMEGLKAHVLSIKPSDPRFSEKNCTNFREHVRQLRLLMRKRVNYDDIPKIYAEVKSLFERQYSYYYLGYFMGGPWGDEYAAKWAEGGKRTAKLQYDNRAYSEGLLKQFSDFVETLCIQKLGALAAEIDTTSLTVKEVEDLLLRDKLPNEKLVKLRERGYVFVKGRLVLSDDFIYIMNKYGYEYHPKEIQEEMTLNGEVAYRAKSVTGKVRLVLNNRDLPKFRKGEIMVAPMTQPIYMDAMKIAKAIVTDEGEITCHAAIESRRMKIPCVIGTNSATTRLRDGDKIIVDAEKGIVRKLGEQPKLNT